jgi:DNA-binding MarR family transcriptional regulator
VSEKTSGDLPSERLLLGREFTSSVVMFHEAVGRLLGLSAAERKCLDVLDRLGPVTAGRIAAHTGLTTGAITGMIDRLSRAGYVKRTPNPDDRRSVLVSLRSNTPRDTVLPKVFEALGRDMAEVNSHFEPDQLEAIAEYLTRTTEVLHRRTRSLTEDDGQ